MATAAQHHRLRPLLLWTWAGVWSLSLLQALSAQELLTDGRVLDIDDSTFNSAINRFDFVLVDFCAPWCDHCKRLDPELDAAARILAEANERIVIAKLNADKYTKLAANYKINGFPTLKLFMHGVPVDYTGSRKADLLVKFMRKFVKPDVSLLESDSAVHSFVEAAEKEFPIFIGFGLDDSLIAEFARKYKTSAWFAVAKGFSEEVMVAYDFDKIPALVVLHPKYDEQTVFYGPFEGAFLVEFFQQNQLPLSVPIDPETLVLMSNDRRNTVLTFMEDATDEKSVKLRKILRAAAMANRDLIFGYIGFKQWDVFAPGTFSVNNISKLPKMVVWNRGEEYVLVVVSENLDDEGDQASQVSRFLEGYREGRTVKIRSESPSKSSSKSPSKSPSFTGFNNSLISIKTVYLIVFIVAVIMLFLSFSGQDEHTPETKQAGSEADDTNGGIPERESHPVDYQPGAKED